MSRNEKVDHLAHRDLTSTPCELKTSLSPRAARSRTRPKRIIAELWALPPVRRQSFPRSPVTALPFLNVPYSTGPTVLKEAASERQAKPQEFVPFGVDCLKWGNRNLWGKVHLVVIEIINPKLRLSAVRNIASLNEKRVCNVIQVTRWRVGSHGDRSKFVQP